MQRPTLCEPNKGVLLSQTKGGKNKTATDGATNIDRIVRKPHLAHVIYSRQMSWTILAIGPLARYYSIVKQATGKLLSAGRSQLSVEQYALEYKDA